MRADDVCKLFSGVGMGVGVDIAAPKLKCPLAAEGSGGEPSRYFGICESGHDLVPIPWV